MYNIPNYTYIYIYIYIYVYNPPMMDLRVGPLEVPTSVIEFSLLENCVRDALQARFGRDLERIRTLYAFDAIWFLYGFYMDSI